MGWWGSGGLLATGPPACQLGRLSGAAGTTLSWTWWGLRGTSPASIAFALPWGLDRKLGGKDVL